MTKFEIWNANRKAVKYLRTHLSPKYSQKGKLKYFDWYLLAAPMMQFEPSEVMIGLKEDFSGCSGEIYVDNKFTKEIRGFVHLSSPWAAPSALFIVDGQEIMLDCWSYDAISDVDPEVVPHFVIDMVNKEKNKWKKLEKTFG
jgi:hypothetical protein